VAAPRNTPVLEKSRTPEMFSEIAHRYDFLNHFLSMNVDRRWRRALVDMAGVSGGGRVLDVATGTGDVAIEFARRTAADTIVGLDPSEGMLAVGREKLRRARLEGRVRLLDGDALAMPFAAGSFDAVTIAFGLRNLPDYGAGIAEMARVLAPGGRLLILEFSPPRRGLFLRAYRFYLGHVLPRVGSLVSGSAGAYRYLARSIEEFISHEDIRNHMASAGLTAVEARRLTGGIAYIHTGVRR